MHEWDIDIRITIINNSALKIRTNVKETFYFANIKSANTILYRKEQMATQITCVKKN